jgi:hypothetical protein
MTHCACANAGFPKEILRQFFKKNISESRNFHREILTARQTPRRASDTTVDLSVRNRATSGLLEKNGMGRQNRCAMRLRV